MRNINIEALFFYIQENYRNYSEIKSFFEKIFENFSVSFLHLGLQM